MDLERRTKTHDLLDEKDMKIYFYTVWTSNKNEFKIKLLEIKWVATWCDKKQKLAKFWLIYVVTAIIYILRTLNISSVGVAAQMCISRHFEDWESG